MSSRPILVGLTLFALSLPSPSAGQELHQAIQAGDEDQVKSLLANGADPNGIGPRGLSAVDLAFWIDCQRNSKMLDTLLGAGGELKPDAPWPLPVSRLHLAATFGHAGMASLLLERGTDPNQVGRGGETALLMAARGGHRALVRVLLEHGADVEIRDGAGGTPLSRAVERGHADVVTDLLEAGASVVYSDPGTGQTLLHLAALGGHLDIVRTLLSQGVPVGVLDAEGRSPLYYAAAYGHRGVAELLQKEGADASEMEGARFGSSPILREGMNQGEAALWYLNHRGWAVKTAENFLVFDQEEYGVTRPSDPALANGFLTPAEVGRENVTALYTCYHGEVGEPAYIHTIEDSLESVVYVQNAGDRWRGSDRSVYLSPRESAQLKRGSVTTVGTMTQMATLGHLVEVDGLRLYYQGFRPDDLEYYEGELDYLGGVTDRIDIAFLPIPDPDGDPNLSGFKMFLDRFHPSAVALLDPERREDLYPGVADLTRDWGFGGDVYVASYPGDEFFFRRGG